MIQPLVDTLCRVYTIACPACGKGNTFPRYTRDVCRSSSNEPEGPHKELTSRHFTLNGNALPIEVSMGFSAIKSYMSTPKSLQKGLYKRSTQALDNAKIKGNQIEFIQHT